MCWTCGERGHIASKCRGRTSNDSRREVMLGSCMTPPVVALSLEMKKEKPELFAPYTLHRYVSSDQTGKSVVVIRDSGVAQFLILKNSLPEEVSINEKEKVIFGGFPSTL